MIRTQVSKHLLGARWGESKGEKEMSGEEQLPEERWRRVGMSGLMRVGGQKR